MDYTWRKATLVDKKEVYALYYEHRDEVDPLSLDFKIRQFFNGKTDDTVEIWVCEEATYGIIACFHMQIKGVECHVGSGLCHRDHRRLGPAKMARVLYRKRAVSKGCTTLVRKHKEGAVHVNMKKLEISAAWGVKYKDGWITLIGDLTKLDGENQY